MGQIPPPLTSILVLPGFPWADTGSGQRSLLFLEAAARLGPVHVVCLSDWLPEGAATRLPQAASIAAWGAGALQIRGWMRHIHHGALRLIAPAQFYRIDPSPQQKLQALIRQTGADAVIFRYATTFCATGLSKRDDLAVLVDIDDRDDQKYATRLKRLLGERLGGTWPMRRLLNRLAVMLKARLQAASLMWFAGREDVWTLPGVDSAVLPNVPMIGDGAALVPPSQGDTVLFVGIGNHIPNRDGVIWFLDQCWPELARRFPGIRFRIVGRGREWPELAARYAGIAQVDFVGPVEDLQAEYSRARLCICPVREGGGSKIKVIEAAGYARPVVGVPHALRGFEGGIGDLITSAASAQGFIDACADILADPDLADRRGAALAEWQQRLYSRDSALSRIASDIGASVAG